MLELLRDPVWQFIGAVLAAIATGAAFWIYWLQRQTKELAFGIVSSRRLLSVADEVSSRVTVQLDGKAVTNLHLLVYGLKNSGHRAVAPSDFERPLSISFSEGQVVSAEVASQAPANLGVTLVVTESNIELQPLLLNAGDQILIQVLLSAPSPSESVSTRIIDVPTLVPINLQPRLPPFLESGTPMLAVMCILIAVGSYLFDPDGQGKPAYFLGFMGFAAFVILHGLGTRLFERIGPAARRYISEV